MTADRRATLLALAAEVERAEAGDIVALLKLDERIALLVHGELRGITPSYCASLDAAASLVPEGAVECRVGWRNKPDTYEVSAWAVVEMRDGKQYFSSAATPALALVAAALRAQAEGGENEG